MRAFTYIIFYWAALITSTIAANILGLFPLPFKSHYIIYSSIMTELAHRGHNVTVVSTFPRSEVLANFTDISVDECVNFPSDIFSIEGAYKSHDPFTQMPILMSLADLHELVLSCKPMQQLLGSDHSIHYDLVITEVFNSDIMAVFASKFQAPLASFCAVPIFPWGADRTANPDNPAYVTFPHTDRPVGMYETQLCDRVYNFLLYVYAKMLFYFTNIEAEQVMRNIFPDIASSSSLSEIVANTSIILTFSHFSINQALPLVPNVIQISGLQIQNPNELPEDIQDFIDESEYGVVYFCMGSLLRSETMPEEKKNAFIHAFSQIPQRVLWKWGSDQLPGKTDNVYISKWMPQRDILAHPNVKLFISHGGALGLNEAVYEGIPVLGIPMYADQTANLKVLESYGAAEILEYTDIDNATVLSKIQRMLNSNRYSENMNKVSRIFRDRPMSPMDTAIYWIEYVIRHKGAHHLRSAATDMPLYQYLLLDVIAFILICIFVVILIFYYFFKLLLVSLQTTTFSENYNKNK